MPSSDLDLRLVRYFAAVAEHQHFGRAATALGITQPSLSRQVRQLERQLGVRLLDRTPQGSRLTDAGATFLEHARELLCSAQRATAHTRSAAAPRRLTVGYTTGLIATPAVLAMRRRHPECEIRNRHVEWGRARVAVLDHEVDAVITRLPLGTDGLDVTPLFDEPRFVVVSVDHRLAGKESVGLDDIADEPLPRMPDADPAWTAFWRLEPRPDGRPAPDGPVVEDLADKLELVAAGQMVTIAAGRHTHLARPDLTTVPLDGVEPSHVVLITRSGDRRPLIAEFIACAHDHLPAV